MDFYFMAVVMLHCGFCHAAPNNIQQLYAPDPAEVNNLYVEVDNVNEYRDVAPLTQTSDELNVEETVREVEELIKNNAKLPRLTRGEIIDIIENITKTDITMTPNKTRANGKKSLMMVMPFTVGSAQGDINELYTRTPVTHIIGPEAPGIAKPKKKAVRKRPTFQPIYFEEEQQSLVQDSKRPEMHFLETTVIPPSIATAKSTYQTTSRTERYPTTHVTNIPRVSTTIAQTTAARTTTFRPVVENKPKPTRKHEKPQKYSNHRYPGDAPKLYVPDNGIRVVDAPTLLKNQYNEYSAPYVISSHKIQHPHSGKIGGTFISTTQKPITVTTQNTMLDDIVPDNFKSVIKDLDILIKPDENNQYVAMYHKQPTYNRINESVRTQVVRSSTTTTTPMPDISNVAGNLSPDMRDLLMNFGLLQNPNEKPTVSPPPSDTFVQKAEINPESYLGFKPLPVDVPTRDDMDEFLSRFGLGRDSARSQKSIAMGKPKKESGKMNLDAVPNSLKDVANELGFGEDYAPVKSANDITVVPKHVFKPSKQNATKDELEKLSKLLDMIKDLDKLNRNVTAENLQQLDMKTLKELIGSFNGEKMPLDERGAPNPLNYVHDIMKNDVKRQEALSTSSTALPSSTTTDESTTVSATTTTIVAATTTEEERNSQLADLEASFGGSQITTTETAVTTRRTGFYYLLDWNTFLDIDDQKGKRVNLRFQPHAGVPRNFLNVQVP